MESQPTIDISQKPSIDKHLPLTECNYPRSAQLDFYALRSPSKPSKEVADNISLHSEDASDPMQVDQANESRTLRKRKWKVAKHLRRGANEKEMYSFTKRVLRIPIDKPFGEAYFTDRLWMFFRETRRPRKILKGCFIRSERR
ncbi:hypothetical protein Bca52824_011489 [Brassica carinata]|uniref:Uncharacterized protein n=1 Tax=Brassica carinata TaxID=52824 RepID=A0A8X7WFJ4_BRACI|nr:hypothetical protein Bca52824_011489 [Brassica carinata]